MQVSKSKEMLAQSKFYMGYSRWVEDKQAYETWEESVERVMNMHRQKYAGKMTPVLEGYISFAEQAYKDQLILGAQRALQFGGEQLFKHEARMYNCLKDTTEFVTNNGVKSFKDFQDGSKVTVLTHTGSWKNAVVKQYGNQKLSKIVFNKSNSHDNVVFATANHRWLLKDGSETTSLKEGDSIYKPVNTFGEFDYDNANPNERLYWCYGMVYGDGTKVKDKSGDYKYSMIRLCSDDKNFSNRFEEVGFKTSTNNSLNGDFIAYTGTYLKTTPNPEIDSPELIRAFVAGYLQADGAKDSNKSGTQYLSIQSSEKDHIEFIRKCFPVAGVWIISEKDLTGQETNFGIRGETISFRVTDSMGSKYNQGWVVSSIEDYSEEIVWCLEVEDDKSFILPNGIVTGNCSVSHCDRPAFFNEAFYLLLCGCGVGFSVQKHHIAKLPKITKRSNKEVKIHQVEDSIEGWADSVAVLLSSYLVNGGVYPEYKGQQVHFDFSEVRPKGSFISGGFSAPGPDGLRDALLKIEKLLEAEVKGEEPKTIRPIVAYDITMHMSDAVLSGGVRRSATICLFDKDDDEMMKAKTGDWWATNPQRGRSNNSAMIKRDEITRQEWAEIMKSVKDYGEPGFIFTDNKEFAYNPCVEIGMLPTAQDGESGFQFCNLSECNGGKITSKELLERACKAAAILGTLQAGYTNFKYVSDATRRITEHEALIGVSITGWMNNPDILFDEDNMKLGAEIVKQTNKEVSKLLGINQAARTTCAKPSGNASVILGTASGIHGEHSPMYFRNVQMNEQDEVLKLLQKENPKMIQKSVWSANGTDYVVSFPIVSKEGSIYKDQLLGVKQLDYVKKAQQVWVEEGTVIDLCVDKNLRHNISNTITVDDWDEVEEYLFKNRQYFAGVSLLSSSGDKAYAQAPFTEVFTAEQILDKYKEGAMFASGVIVDALHAFNDNLWIACDTVSGYGLTLTEQSSDLLKRDWVRRAKKYANQYFNDDVQLMTFCLKDCYNLHLWSSIEKTMKFIDFSEELTQKKFTDVDTLGSQGCAGGACEISF